MRAGGKGGGWDVEQGPGPEAAGGEKCREAAGVCTRGRLLLLLALLLALIIAAVVGGVVGASHGR